MLGALLDKTLDAAIVPGYTSVGYRLRRLAWDDAELRSMDGKVVLVTGATSGLGLAAAEGFARLGAGVRLLARSEERGERARARIVRRTGNRDIAVGVCDLADVASIHDFVAGFKVEEDSLHVLVNNAGAMLARRELSVDGIELTFATNVLGPFLLTNLLLPLLRASAPARIINVSSGGMYAQRLDTADPQSERASYDGTAAYARAKRAEVALTGLWAERLRGTGVVVHAMHPGWADTPGVRSSLPGFYRATKALLRSPEQGADTVLWLAAAEEPALRSGGFWHDRRERPLHRLPWTRETAEQRELLWRECERLSGWREGTPSLPPGAPGRLGEQHAGGRR